MKDLRRTESSQKKSCPLSSEAQPVPVLYQKLGSQWYFFSLIQDEVYYGKVEDSSFEAVSFGQTKGQS